MIDRPQRYRDESDKLRPELFDGEARAEAEQWQSVKSSQLRRFYGAVTAFVRKIDLDQSQGDTDVLVSMALLKASATYAAARDKNHAAIRDFFEHHARIVKTLRDYRDFARHFEAVVAYHKAFEKNVTEDRS